MGEDPAICNILIALSTGVKTAAFGTCPDFAP